MAATAETAKVPQWLQTPKGLKTPISSYEHPPPEIPAEPLRLLEKYGKIPPEKALDYVVSFVRYGTPCKFIPALLYHV